MNMWRPVHQARTDAGGRGQCRAHRGDVDRLPRAFRRKRVDRFCSAASALPTPCMRRWWRASTLTTSSVGAGTRAYMDAVMALPAWREWHDAGVKEPGCCRKTRSIGRPFKSNARALLRNVRAAIARHEIFDGPVQNFVKIVSDTLQRHYHGSPPCFHRGRRCGGASLRGARHGVVRHADPFFRARCFVVRALPRPPSPPTPNHDVKGLYLLTDYPAVTVQPGTTSTVNLRLRNYDTAARAAGAVGRRRAARAGPRRCSAAASRSPRRCRRPTTACRSICGSTCRRTPRSAAIR